MTIQAVLSFVNIIPNEMGDSFVNQIQSLLATLYGSSPTIQSALDIRVATGIPLNIEFVAGAMHNVSIEYGPINIDTIQIDPDFANQFASINQFGNVLPRGFAYMFLHELCHALFATEDPSLDDLNSPGFDFIGDNVRLENLALMEMGISDLRVGYFATFQESTTYLDSYTGGASIDYAFKNDLGFGYVDASQSMQKDGNGLLVGSSTGGTLIAGNGRDYVWGLEGSDYLYGGAGNDIVIGGAGADQLFGDGDDDFIFFDAADGTNVNGGAGRDVAVALGQDGVTVNMTAQGLEVCIGGAGADEITCAGSEEALFAAGSDGADTFNVSYDQSEGPKVLWGGSGADTFNFSIGDPENEFDWQLGIAVVRIEGLTEEMFASLTLADLSLGGVDLSKIDAIIVNPDSADRFYWGGSTMGTSMLNVEDYDYVGDYPHFVTGYDIPVVSGVLSSGYLGGDHSIQSVYFREVRVETYYTYAYDYYQIDVTATGDVVVTETDFFSETWHDNLQEAIDQALQDSVPWFEENDPYWVVQGDGGDRPAAPFFVVGGSFSGSSLSSSGALTAPTPEDPGATPFDWLLVA